MPQCSVMGMTPSIAVNHRVVFHSLVVLKRPFHTISTLRIIRMTNECFNIFNIIIMSGFMGLGE
jgi:hypothetical protein